MQMFMPEKLWLFLLPSMPLIFFSGFGDSRHLIMKKEILLESKFSKEEMMDITQIEWQTINQ